MIERERVRLHVREKKLQKRRDMKREQNKEQGNKESKASLNGMNHTQAFCFWIRAIDINAILARVRVELRFSKRVNIGKSNGIFHVMLGRSLMCDKTEDYYYDSDRILIAELQAPHYLLDNNKPRCICACVYCSCPVIDIFSMKK